MAQPLKKDHPKDPFIAEKGKSVGKCEREM